MNNEDAGSGITIYGPYGVYNLQGICADYKYRDSRDRARDYHHKGKDYQAQAGWWKAIEQYDEAIRLDPQCVKCYRAKGMAHGGLSTTEGTEVTPLTSQQPYKP